MGFAPPLVNPDENNIYDSWSQMKHKKLISFITVYVSLVSLVSGAIFSTIGFAAATGPDTATCGPLNQQLSNSLSGLAMDPSTGNLYVSDENNSVIRKYNYSTNYSESIYAGQMSNSTPWDGVKGSWTYNETVTTTQLGDGGLATSAQLNQPRKLAWDNFNHNLLFLDFQHEEIRRINSSGIISTVFTMPLYNSGSLRTSVYQNQRMQSFAVNSATGDIYVGMVPTTYSTSYGGQIVRILNTDMNATTPTSSSTGYGTIATNLVGSPGSLSGVTSMAVGTDGTVYVGAASGSNSSGGAIIAISPPISPSTVGVVTKLNNLTGSSSLTTAWDLTFDDANNLWAGLQPPSGPFQIVKFDALGLNSYETPTVMVDGSGSNLLAATPNPSSFVRLAVNSSKGGIFIADNVTMSILQISSLSAINQTISFIAGVKGTAGSQCVVGNPISVTQSPGGTIAPTSKLVTSGTQNFTFTPSAGYVVSSVTLDTTTLTAITTPTLASVIASGYTYTYASPDTAHSITATFTAPSRIITVTQGSNGTISPGTTTVTGGSSQTFTFAPSSGYTVASITIDGTLLSASTTPTLASALLNGYPFNSVVAVHTVTATYALITYAITVTQGSHGTISPDSATVTAGNNQKFTFTPSTGYSVGSITVDGNALSGSSLASAIADGYTFSSVATTHTIAATYLGATYSVTYYDNGTYNGGITTGSLPNAQSYTVGGSTLTLAQNSGSLALGTAVLTGWNTVSDGSGTSYSLGQTGVTAASNLSLYAQWAAPITYKANTGVGSQTSDTYTVRTGSVTLPVSTTFTKTGYSFGGWANSETSTTPVLTYATISAVNIYAIWTHNSYAVTFYPNNVGATGTMAVETMSATTALTTNSYKLVNNVFLTWNTAANGTGTSYTDGQNYLFVANTPLYAQWGSVITYSSVGADSGNPTRSSENWSSGAITSLPTVGSMLKAGYSFGGWSNGISTYVTTYTPTTGITLNPVWTANSYTVSFNNNGAGSGTVPGNQTWTESSTALTLLGNTGTLAKPGYSFGGWAISASSPQSAITTFSSTSSTLVKTLYAIWSPVSYTVTYDLNSGTSTLPTEINHNIYDAFTVAATPTRDTYVFGGWSNGTTIYSAGNSYTVATSNITLAAQWIATFTVHYVMNGSATTPAVDALYASGTVITTAAAPTLTGYTFDHWLASNTLTPAASADFAVIANSTLTATWTPVAYSVTYALNGGTSTLPTQANVNINNIFRITPTDPIRAGYLFTVWSDGTSTLGAGASYAVGSANIILTAQWAAVSYIVIYDLGGGVGTLPTHANVNITDSFIVSTVSNPTWLAHTFAGWSDGTSSYANSANYVTGSRNITLTAVWTLNGYTQISYALGGGSGTLPTQSALLEGSTFAVASGAGLVKSGQAFIGWNDATSNYQLNEIYLVGSYAAPIVLTAQWGTGYSVTYSAGTGSGTVPTDSVIRITSTTFTLSDGSTLSQSGYTFAGWSDGVTIYLGSTSQTIGSTDLIFTAQWALVITAPSGGESQPGRIEVNKLTPSTASTSTIVAAEISIIQNQSQTKAFFAADATLGAIVKTQSTSSPNASQITSAGVLTSINTKSATTTSLQPANFKLPATEIVLSDLVVKLLESQVKIVATESGFSVTPVAGFTGTLIIPIVATLNGIQVTVLNRVVVNPVSPVAIGFSPKSEKMSAIMWTPSMSQVVAYVVAINGKISCETTSSSCRVPSLIGPKSKVTISAEGNDQTASLPKVIPYVATVPIPALKVNFGTGSAILTKVQKLEIKAIALVIKREGFTRLVINGFPDAQGNKIANANLSNVRAEVIARYMQILLPKISMKVPAFGAKNTLGSNTTAAGQSQNRGTEIATW